MPPQILAALVRRYGQFDACEDAVQEALLAATLQWPGEGIPERPRSWLLTVAAARWSTNGAPTAPGAAAKPPRRSTRPTTHRMPTSQPTSQPT